MSNTAQHGMGRLVAVDERDRMYPLRTAITESPTRDYFYHRTGPILDQSTTGTCVGHAWRQWLSSGLIMTRSGPDAFTIYRESCQRDVWTENDNGDLQFGTSIRAGAKTLQERGHISEYRWTRNAGEMLDWLLLGKGVLVVGSLWYRGMSEPDRNGVLHLTGPIDGGHAYIVTGGNRTRGLLRIANSWSEQWGQRGRAWITVEDMQKLLDSEGECCTATEIKKGAA